MRSLTFHPQVPVFDANVGVGHRHDQPSPVEDADQLLEEMARHGVARAVIYHVQGERISAIDGNDRLDRWANGHDAFSLQYMVGANPDTLKQLQDRHANGRVTSVRLQPPNDNLAPFVDWLYGDLLSWLSAAGIPLWICLADTPATDLMNTLKKFPDLTTVLIGAHYTHAAFISPLLNHLPNTFLELSRYENLNGVNKLIAAHGVERFLYGSYYPRYAMGPILFYLHHMGLDQTTLATLCSSNLERLLGNKS